MSRGENDKISLMTTAGEILKNERLRKKLTLEEVEKATKIRLKNLLAIENSSYGKLPHATFVKGLLKNYADYLGLRPESVVAFYRREIAENTGMEHPKKPLSENKLRITPNFVTALTVGFLTIIFIFFLFISGRGIFVGPRLIIDEPQNNTVYNQAELKIKGQTDAETRLVLNGAELKVENDGRFSQIITLTPGLNVLTLEAVNKAGRTTKAVRNVRLETP